MKNKIILDPIDGVPDEAPTLSSLVENPEDDALSQLEQGLTPYGSTNGDPDMPGPDQFDDFSDEHKAERATREAERIEAHEEARERHRPKEAATLTVILPPRQRARGRKKKEPVGLAPGGYIAHVASYHAYMKRLRWESVPSYQPRLADPNDPTVVQADPSELFGSTGRPVYPKADGKAYPMDAETFAKWKAKYGKRATDQIAKEAQLAIDTSYRRYFPDGGTEWSMARTVPAIEREVRAYCEAQSIELDSFYDPEARRWFKFWIRPEGITLQEMGRIEKLVEQAGKKRLYRKAAWEMREFSLSDLRSIEGDVWRDMNPSHQKAIIEAKYQAYRSVIAASNWHDDLLIAQLKTCDQLMFMNEKMMTNVADTGRVARWELRELFRANDDTEIPLQEIERKQDRIDGLKVQWWDGWAGFQAAKRLRAEVVGRSPIPWSQYRSIEQRAKDQQNVRRLRNANSHRLSAMEVEQFGTWSEEAGYTPHRPE